MKSAPASDAFVIAFVVVANSLSTQQAICLQVLMLFTLRWVML